MTDAALVLAGHGSHRNPGSASPVFAHADRIRSQEVFSEVRAAFWKEEPELREVLRSIASDSVYVVPVMMSEGYFVDQIFPRELGVTRHGPGNPDKTVHYTPPVGTHPTMTDVVINRAKTMTDNAQIGPGVGLVLVGHGTDRNAKSAATTYYHAARVRARDRFDDVTSLFMDEDPAITDWEAHVESNEVVVVPFFVADGYHTQEDIPADIGLPPDATGSSPVSGSVNGRRVWYTGAVGTAPGVTAVILERCRDAGATLTAADTVEPKSGLTTNQAAFLSWITEADLEGRTWGELLITGSGTDGFAVRHKADRDIPSQQLEPLTSPEAVRDRTRFTESGEYRPLRGARTLPTGWYAPELSAGEVVTVVDFVYPVSITDWARKREGELDAESFEETARRQTGLYAAVDDMGAREVASTISACCDTCVKHREWSAPGESQPAESGQNNQIPCRAPCSFLIAAAREFMEIEPAEESADIDFSIRPGDMAAPGNRYRVRYRDAHRVTEPPAPVSGGQR